MILITFLVGLVIGAAVMGVAWYMEDYKGTKDES